MRFKLLKKSLPYLCILCSNLVLKVFFVKSYTIIFIPLDVLISAVLCLRLSFFLNNRYNLIISHFWLAFYFLGVLNINSAIIFDTTWKVNIHHASMLYFLNLIVFIISLIYFERKIVQRRRLRPAKIGLLNLVFWIPFVLFPFVFIYSLYKSLGFLPILSGGGFVDFMYNYNYGPLYGYKFLCVYSFLIGAFWVITKRFKCLSIVFVTLVLFILSVDGKRFLLLVSLLALLPLNDYLRRMKDPSKKVSYLPFIMVFLGVVVVYVSILAIRMGSSDIGQWVNLFINKIPFGIEFKDYVFSFEKLTTTSTERYDFLSSSIGAFVNSNVLSFFGYSKEGLTQLGSAYIWRDAYNIEFGIRTGIISELYFAFGIWGSLFMILLAFFVNKTSNRINQPNSVFGLFQHSILFALYILLITGQATVFFGCLSIMVYVFLYNTLSNFVLQGRLRK